MKKIALYALPFLLVFAAWISYPFVITSTFGSAHFPVDNWQTRGVIGDSFGALNTLFAGFALAGLAINIYLQSVQLRKLEEREAENERQLEAQADALRYTALLNYYNSETDYLSKQLADELVSPRYADDMHKQIQQLRSDRSVIVQIIKSELTHPAL